MRSSLITGREKKGVADGVVITPSHNPPEDGGFKYNPPEGGPADPETTRIIEERANQIIAQRLKEVKRTLFEKAFKADSTLEYDYILPYVDDLKNVIDMEVISRERLKIGADPSAARPLTSSISSPTGMALTSTL